MVADRDNEHEAPHLIRYLESHIGWRRGVLEEFLRTSDGLFRGGESIWKLDTIFIKHQAKLIPDVKLKDSYRITFPTGEMA